MWFWLAGIAMATVGGFWVGWFARGPVSPDPKHEAWAMTLAKAALRDANPHFKLIEWHDRATRLCNLKEQRALLRAMELLAVAKADAELERDLKPRP